MRVRFRKLMKAIVQAVAVNDVFGLRSPTVFANVVGVPIVANANIPGQNAFRFLRSGDKVNSFMSWLKEAQKDNILDVTFGTGRTIAGSGAWTDVYIESAYTKGLQAAGNNLKQQGFDVTMDGYVQSAFMKPVHADRAGLIYTRAFNELTGISDAMDQQISRVLAQGIAEGKGPKAIARDMVNRVDKVGMTRAQTLARTEVIAAHADAALNSYEEMGVFDVTAEVEFATAGDSSVCPQCESLSGQVYNLTEARGVIPVHPNCRCSWLPIVKA